MISIRFSFRHNIHKTVRRNIRWGNDKREQSK